MEVQGSPSFLNARTAETKGGGIFSGNGGRRQRRLVFGPSPETETRWSQNRRGEGGYSVETVLDCNKRSGIGGNYSLSKSNRVDCRIEVGVFGGSC